MSTIRISAEIDGWDFDEVQGETLYRALELYAQHLENTAAAREQEAATLRLHAAAARSAADAAREVASENKS